MNIKDSYKFRELIKNEVERLAIRNVIEGPSKKTLIDNLKHPLVSVLLGFILTGIVGTLLTQYFQEQEKKAFLQKEANIHIRQFAQSLAFRNTEAAYLKSALLRRVDEKIIRERKSAYDVSVKQWNTDLIKNLLTFREYSESQNRIFIESNIENDLVPILRAIDICITEVFDEPRDHNTVSKNEGISCWILVAGEEYMIELSSLLNASRSCGYEITNLLFSFVAINLKIYDKGWPDKPNMVQVAISKKCKVVYATMKQLADKPPHRTAVPLGFPVG